MDELVKVGFIRRIHALKGQVVISSLTDFPEERFAPGSVLLLQGKNGVSREIEVEFCSEYKDGFLIKFCDVDSAEQANQLRGLYLCIQNAERLELEENEFYADELIGMEVFDSSENRLGTVSELIQSPAHPILELSSGEAIPFVREFVQSIDRTARKLKIHKRNYAD
ncbi:MAG: 16S rRNA processing protein RimM [Candidatus Cloacimonetes bacterium]|nr:16S rRNA processing protein RimM [Candidatus Cloacimonadota bacterium]